MAGVAVASAPFHALYTETVANTGARARVERGPHPVYGPLQAVADRTTGLPLLWLPAGFTYHSFGWTGDRLDDGSPTPAAHDGMAAFSAGPSRIRIVRNHEVTCGVAFAPELAYDPGAGGGTTTLELDAASAELLAARPSLSGTSSNCAGGPTPWGSWLSCEETLGAPALGNTLRRRHGYIFEVPADGHGSAEPLRAMGIHGLTTDGQIFTFARNNVRLAGERNGWTGDFTDSEFAGVTYSPDGRWLFFNIQFPGITFAVTGPWGDGGL